MEESTLRDIEVKKDFIKFMESRIKENESKNVQMKESIERAGLQIKELCDCKLPNGESTMYAELDTESIDCPLCEKTWYVIGKVEE